MKRILFIMAVMFSVFGAAAAEKDLIPCYSSELSWSGASMEGNTAKWESAWGGLVFNMENKDYSEYKYVVMDFAEPTTCKLKLEVYYATDEDAAGSLEMESGATQIKLNLDAAKSTDIAKIALLSAKPCNVTISKAVLTDTYEANPVIWEGDTELVNMNTNFTVKADKLANVKLGDHLTVYFEVGANANYGTIQFCYGWTKMAADAGKTNTKSDGNFAKNATQTTVVLKDQADVDGLLKSGLRLKGKNVILRKIMLTDENTEPEPPVTDPDEPKDPENPDEPEIPATGEGVIWTGSVATGEWTNDVTVDAGYFAKSKAGDKIVITLKVADGAEFGNIEVDDQNYNKLSADGKGDNLDEFGCVQPDVTSITYIIENGDIDLLKANGLRVKGANIIIEKIELALGTALPSDPEPSDTATIWTGSVNCGQWKQEVLVEASKFADMKPGDKLSIDLSINAGKGKGYVEVSAQDGTVLDANGKGSNMDSSGMITNRSAKEVVYVLEAADVDRLKQHGLKIRGFAVTVTKARILFMPTVSIDLVEDNSECPVEYYNMSGMRVENPTAGLYIKKQGSKISKVMVR